MSLYHVTESPPAHLANAIPAYRRAALEKWKQRLGYNATYNRLINVFERAGYSGYASTVRSCIIYGKFLIN